MNEKETRARKGKQEAERRKKVLADNDRVGETWEASRTWTGSGKASVDSMPSIRKSSRVRSKPRNERDDDSESDVTVSSDSEASSNSRNLFVAYTQRFMMHVISGFMLCALILAQMTMIILIMWTGVVVTALAYLSNF